MLKDDKTYPWICIKKERFPRVFLTRKVLKDGSDYFGPFPFESGSSCPFGDAQRNLPLAQLHL